MNKMQSSMVVKPLVAATVNFIKASDGLVELYASHGLIAWADVRHTVAAAIEEKYSCTMHESERTKDYTSTNEAAKKQFARLKSVFMDAPEGKGANTDPVAAAIKACAKLSWSDWAKVVKSIEATR